MVAPISGDKTKEWGTPNPSPGASSYKKRVWRTQAKPYNLALPFSFVEGYAYTDLPLGYNNYGASAYIGDPSAAFRAGVATASADNRCREKLYSKLGEAVDLATNLAERRQAVHMIAARAIQLRRAFQATRKGRLKEAARILGVDNDPKKVSRRKTVANNWLELHLGWAPLIGDIHSAVEVLQGPVPVRRVRARASAAPVTRTWNGYPTMPPYGKNAWKEWWSYEVRSGFDFVVSNPDLWLANRLGLINPATVAWEIVPFSFVVDWFIPVGDFLGSMTATVGLSVSNGWTSYRVFYQKHTIQLTATPANPERPTSYFGWGVNCNRRLGALSATPTLTLTPSFSPVRAFTAISLLIQQMKMR